MTAYSLGAAACFSVAVAVEIFVGVAAVVVVVERLNGSDCWTGAKTRVTALSSIDTTSSVGCTDLD